MQHIISLHLTDSILVSHIYLSDIYSAIAKIEGVEYAIIQEFNKPTEVKKNPIAQYVRIKENEIPDVGKLTILAEGGIILMSSEDQTSVQGKGKDGQVQKRKYEEYYSDLLYRLLPAVYQNRDNKQDNDT